MARLTDPLPAAVDTVKALAHPARLRILAMLGSGSLCVCQITAVLGSAASTVSAHLAELRRAGFVSERRDGRWVHYERAKGGSQAGLLRQALRLAGDDPRLGEDARNVAALRRIPLETFCRTGAGAAPDAAATAGRPRRRQVPARRTR
jgi:ArsR family transcriptional regulator, arsenate/arsenite/antimonite-responsive transcriptional repressor